MLRLKHLFHAGFYRSCFRSLIIGLANATPPLNEFRSIRYRLFSLAGMCLAPGVCFQGNVVVSPIDRGENIIIGANTFINNEVRFAAPSAFIRIGKGCAIGPRVSFETVNHRFPGNMLEHLPIEVGDKCWIGSGAIVLPGIVIGDDVVVAAGSVVTKNIPSSSMVRGFPARIIRNIKVENV
ncbi:MAG: acyltransferase [Gammaproteobacteria bacterium]|nr:acyltransferase [Gammaproteobacteria bacterium]